MTVTYDPFHPKYYDEADLRSEMDRVFDLCHGCRLCFKYCTSFPTMFEYIDTHDDQDSSKMTPAQQDQVVDECFNCKLCYINCPYIPGQHEWNLDFPRLMLRAKQVRYRTKKVPVAQRITNEALGRVDLIGRLATTLPSVANRIVGEPGSKGRELVEKVTGISSIRILDPYVRERFSSWMRKRPRSAPSSNQRQGTAILFPTCQIEYSNPGIGKDFVRWPSATPSSVPSPTVRFAVALRSSTRATWGRS